VKGKANRIYVEPGIWVNNFRIAFDINIEVGTILEIQIGEQPYTEEINRTFIKKALKDSLRKRKKNIATGVDGLLAEVLISVVKTEGREILENFLRKFKEREEFPKNLKMAIVCLLYKSKAKRRIPGSNMQL
jgi:ribosomal protein S17E